MQHWMNKRKRQQRNWQMRYEDSMCPRSRYRRALIRAMQQLCVVMIFSVASLTNDALASEGKHASLTQPEQAASGSLLFRQAEQGVVAYQQAPRLNTDINLAIVGEFVRATVRQRFVNPTDDWVEGVYVFPLPDDAAIDHLTLVIGEQRIVGEIHRRKDAKRIYNTARASGRKAALLSQERPNLFTTAVANIAPRETIEVEIEYQQTVQRAGASHHIRVPLTMTPRFMPGTPLPTTLDKTGSGWSPATDQVLDAQRISPPVIADGIRVSDHRVSLSMSLDAGQPLASLTSRYHPVDVTAIGGTRYTATLKYADELADHDLEIEWQLAESDTALTPAFTHRDESGGYLLARIMPPTLKHVAANIPRSLILVLDTSGSMEGVSLAQAKAAAEYAIDTLEEGDRFNIIEFNSSARALFDVARTASPENKQFALDFVRGLEANGGTNMAPALDYALKSDDPGFVRQVMFVTDGAVGNESALFQLIEQRLGQSRLFTVGIGSAPNGWFMRKAAEAGRGVHTVISAIGEVNVRMRDLFTLMSLPVLTDVRLDWQGVDVEQYPSVVGDLYAGSVLDVTARVQGVVVPRHIDVSATAWTKNGPEPWSRRVPLDWSGSENAPIAVAWARQKIEDLGDQRRRGADAELVRNQIIEVALAHHLVSEATSLVAVDKTPSRAREQLLQQRNIANLKPYGSGNQQSLSTLVPTATSAAMKRWMGSLSLVLALVLLGVSRVRGMRQVWW